MGPRDKQRLGQKGVKEERFSGRRETKVALKVQKLLSFTRVGEPTLPILFRACSGPFSLSSVMDAMHLSSSLPTGN